MIKNLGYIVSGTPTEDAFDMLQKKIDEIVDEVNIQRIMIENEAKMMPRQNLHDWAKIHYERTKK